MSFSLLITQCKVLNTVGSRISVYFGRWTFLVFPFLEHNEIIKISLDFKTNAFVFRVIGVFSTLIFLKKICVGSRVF
jgi:hypothetical protein